MRFVFLLIGIVFFVPVKAQQCDCKSEFLWVKNFMEKNHPGYNSDIKSPDEPAYKKFTRELLQGIEADKTGKYCIVYLKRYVRYLKDHHSNVSLNSRPVLENNKDSLDAFLQSAVYLNTERINGDNASFIKKATSGNDELEGIYITSDTTYTVAVFKNNTQMRDYVGVIVNSRTKTWEKGQVKMEIKIRPDGSREGFIYLRNHAINYLDWTPAVGESPIPGWIKTSGASNTAKAMKPIDNDLVNFKILDASTALVSIRSFSGSAGRELDSAYDKIIPELKKYPNLIIDVRNNGGGSDRNYKALMPLLYTDTIYNDFVEMFYTEDNLKAYEEMRDIAKANPEQWGKTGYQSWEFRINQMKGKTVNSFIPITAVNSTSTYRISKENPVKIAILYNRNCASSCEQLLIDAAFSKKVQLVGEPSGGYIAYGNVMSKITPCGNVLNWTTTRKNKDRKFEFVGVEPQVQIPSGETDWVEYTRQLLARQH